MSDPIDSSRWTGPPESMAAPRTRGAFVHRYGEHQVSTDFARIAAAQADAERRSKEIPPELRGIIGRAWSLLLSPLLLILAWIVVQMSIRDQIGQDNKAYLFACGFGVAALALHQITSRSLRLVWARRALLVVAIVATFSVAIGYVFIAATSWRNAVASAPERTYELYRSTGRGRMRATEVTHQRANGTLLEGGYRAPVRYAYACTLAQRLTGDYGFTWVRVLERSRSRARTELYWPIRREECFRGTPLSSLPS